MSAQIVLTDRQMDLIDKCLRSVRNRTYPPVVLDAEEADIAVEILGRLHPHITRKSRRRPKA